MLQEIVLAGWALTTAIAAAVGTRAVFLLRRPLASEGPGGSVRLAGHLDGDEFAVEQLLAEVGGVVDLIEADAARLETIEDVRTLNLARSLLSSSISRYREATASEV
ncbi:MAG: hypothetical protein R3C39_06760 [Dehalococcoidia bacterium]